MLKKCENRQAISASKAAYVRAANLLHFARLKAFVTSQNNRMDFTRPVVD